ncbi:alpha-L-fucosidase [Pochonia chlamydosporia 170]|uniref:Alpha-L-fucosidase n=1 Tax=Pochonia chlamydosporia 170 TaxID=1380566 RepID=A0A179F473_METCM|nr:alpha-L-fucosidase [Pochonia chlamydosporia 170]OAQ60170.1 alpha-L-fucosidase [Pochonia chlamydosporia 170]
MATGVRRTAPKVAIYGYIKSDEGCSAAVYDTANDDWHGVGIKANCSTAGEETPDLKWLSSVIEKHLGINYTDIQEDEDEAWKTDEMDPQGASFTIQIWPRKEMLDYGCRSTDKFETTLLDITNLRRLDAIAYRCFWKDQDCVLKYIETDADSTVIESEIERRSALIEMSQIPASQAKSEMSRRFCVVPILAVVVADWHPAKPGKVVGILMPYAGEDLAKKRKKSGSNLDLTLQQLQGLVRGVRELGACEVVHGDIKPWNTLLQPSAAAAGPARLMLIDIGMELLGYPGDARALGNVLLFCLENAPALRNDEQAGLRVMYAAKELLNAKLDKAIEYLSATKLIHVESKGVTEAEIESLREELWPRPNVH